MYTVKLITQWTTDKGSNVPIMPTLREGECWSDITGQDAKSIMPDPNIVIIEATLTSDGMTALEADARFLILESMEVVNA